MKHDDQVGTTGRSNRANKVIGRILYAVTTRQLPLIAAATEQTPRIEPNSLEWDASISVWWDQPPCETTPTPR